MQEFFVIVTSDDRLVLIMSITIPIRLNAGLVI